MPIALLGGPLDGAVRDGLAHMPVYLIASNLEDRPIYKRISCLKCPNSPVPYLFIGYESVLQAKGIKEAQEGSLC